MKNSYFTLFFGIFFLWFWSMKNPSKQTKGGKSMSVATITKLFTYFSYFWKTWILFLPCCFWAAALKGTKSCKTQGESVRPYVHLYVRTSVPPTPSSGLRLLWGLFWPIFCQIAQIQAIWPKSKQNGPNPSIMAQIQAKWPKSCQKTPILSWGPSFWPFWPILVPPIPRFWPDLGHFA